MKDKVLVQLIVPDLEETYNVYLPIYKKIGNIIELLNKSLLEITLGSFVSKDERRLYHRDTGMIYPVDKTIIKTDIRNGTCLILL